MMPWKLEGWCNLTETQLGLNISVKRIQNLTVIITFLGFGFHFCIFVKRIMLLVSIYMHALISERLGAMMILLTTCICSSHAWILLANHTQSEHSNSFAGLTLYTNCIKSSKYGIYLILSQLC